MIILRIIILISIRFLFILTTITTNVSAKVKGNEKVEFIGEWSKDAGYWNTVNQLKVLNNPQKYRATTTQKVAGGVDKFLSSAKICRGK